MLDPHRPHRPDTTPPPSQLPPHPRRRTMPPSTSPPAQLPAKSSTAQYGSISLPSARITMSRPPRAPTLEYAYGIQDTDRTGSAPSIYSFGMAPCPEVLRDHGIIGFVTITRVPRFREVPVTISDARLEGQWLRRVRWSPGYGGYHPGYRGCRRQRRIFRRLQSVDGSSRRTRGRLPWLRRPCGGFGDHRFGRGGRRLGRRAVDSRTAVDGFGASQSSVRHSGGHR